MLKDSPTFVHAPTGFEARRFQAGRQGSARYLCSQSGCFIPCLHGAPANCPLPPTRQGSRLALGKVPPPAIVGFGARSASSLLAVLHHASPHPSEEEGDARQAFKGARYCRQEEGHRQGQGKGHRCRAACRQEVSTPDHVNRGPSGMCGMCGMCVERRLVERRVVTCPVRQ